MQPHQEGLPVTLPITAGIAIVITLNIEGIAIAHGCCPCHRQEFIPSRRRFVEARFRQHRLVVPKRSQVLTVGYRHDIAANRHIRLQSSREIRPIPVFVGVDKIVERDRPIAPRHLWRPYCPALEDIWSNARGESSGHLFVVASPIGPVDGDA